MRIASVVSANEVKAASKTEVLRACTDACIGLDDALKEKLSRKADPATPLYEMLSYFLGFLTESFKPEKTGNGGKRFRPALCLFLAEAYGSRDKAFEAALAIELFHNFTLIHDDVEDRDIERRNRPTMWKLWGANHAINSGDMLSLLAAEACMRAGKAQQEILFTAFREIIEGQYLDFELADKSISDPLVSKETALLVNKKKTAALIGALCETAGIAGNQSSDECSALRACGEALGMLFQLADDYRSVWSTKEETGKDSHSDIREHKRTLPFFLAYEELSGEKKEQLKALYELPRQLTEAEVAEALGIINATNANQKTIEAVQKYAQEARLHVGRLSVSDTNKSVLFGIVGMLGTVV